MARLVMENYAQKLEDYGHTLNFLQSVYSFKIKIGTTSWAQNTELWELLYLKFLMNFWRFHDIKSTEYTYFIEIFVIIS